MSISIEDMKLRIATLESLLEGRSKSFVDGYMMAMQDHGLLLTDITEADLDDKFRSKLYSKAFDLTK